MDASKERETNLKTIAKVLLADFIGANLNFGSEWELNNRKARFCSSMAEEIVSNDKAYTLQELQAEVNKGNFSC